MTTSGSRTSGSILLAERLRLRLGGVEVLRSVSLELAAGEVVAVAGPSGSGKTSLVSLLAGHRRPDAGRIVVAGLELDALDEAGLAALRRETTAILTQDFLLLAELTAVRNVAVPLLLAGVAPAEAIRRAGSMLEAVGLDGRLEVRAAVLSRGQQQRVALARALVFPRPVLLLDEPTSSLDPAARDRVVALVRVAAAAGTAVVVTTHDEAVAGAADRRLRLTGGRLEEGL